MRYVLSFSASSGGGNLLSLTLRMSFGVSYNPNLTSAHKKIVLREYRRIMADPTSECDDQSCACMHADFLGSPSEVYDDEIGHNVILSATHDAPQDPLCSTRTLLHDESVNPVYCSNHPLSICPSDGFPSRTDWEILQLLCWQENCRHKLSSSHRSWHSLDDVILRSNLGSSTSCGDLLSQCALRWTSWGRMKLRKKTCTCLCFVRHFRTSPYHSGER